MKPKHIAKLGVSLILLCLINLGMGCKKEMPREITNLQSCNYPQEDYLGELKDFEVTLFPVSMRQEVINYPHIFIPTDEFPIFYFEEFPDFKKGTQVYHYEICNFPSDAKKWKISSNGLKVTITGYLYKHVGSMPLSMDEHYAYLELMIIKQIEKS